VACLPDYLRLTGLAYSGLLAWLFVGYCRLLVLIAAYWPGLLWLTCLVVCWLLQASCAYCRLLAWLIVAYLPDNLRLTGLAYSGLLAWLFVGYCRLLVLIGLAYCGLLA